MIYYENDTDIWDTPFCMYIYTKSFALIRKSFALLRENMIIFFNTKTSAVGLRMQEVLM